jgi:hypothetical protein
MPKKNVDIMNIFGDRAAKPILEAIHGANLLEGATNTGKLEHATATFIASRVDIPGVGENVEASIIKCVISAAVELLKSMFGKSWKDQLAKRVAKSE